MRILLLMIKPTRPQWHITLGGYPVFAIALALYAFIALYITVGGYFTGIGRMGCVGFPAWVAGLAAFVPNPAYIRANIAKNNRAGLQFARYCPGSIPAVIG